MTGILDRAQAWRVGCVAFAVAVCGVASVGCSSSRRRAAAPPAGGQAAPPPPPPPSAPPPPAPPTSSSNSTNSNSAPSNPSQSEQDQAQGEHVFAASLAPAVLSGVCAQAVLSQVSPASYSPPVGVGLTAVGTPSSGTLLIDFGQGSIWNRLTFQGAVLASWTSTAPDRWAVTLGFDEFGTGSLLGGSSTLDGSLTLDLQLELEHASIGLSGSLTRTTTSLLPKLPLLGGGTSTSTIAPNLRYTVFRASGVQILDGTLDVSTDSLGSWSVLARELTFANRQTTSGLLAVSRTNFPAVSVTFRFTAPDAGTYTIDPPGITGSFGL